MERFGRLMSYSPRSHNDDLATMRAFSRYLNCFEVTSMAQRRLDPAHGGSMTRRTAVYALAALLAAWPATALTIQSAERPAVSVDVYEAPN